MLQRPVQVSSSQKDTVYCVNGMTPRRETGIGRKIASSVTVVRLSLPAWPGHFPLGAPAPSRAPHEGLNATRATTSLLPVSCYPGREMRSPDFDEGASHWSQSDWFTAAVLCPSKTAYLIEIRMEHHPGRELSHRSTHSLLIGMLAGRDLH